MGRVVSHPAWQVREDALSAEELSWDGAWDWSVAYTGGGAEPGEEQSLLRASGRVVFVRTPCGWDIIGRDVGQRRHTLTHVDRAMNGEEAMAEIIHVFFGRGRAVVGALLAILMTLC